MTFFKSLNCLPTIVDFYFCNTSRSCAFKHVYFGIGLFQHNNKSWSNTKSHAFKTGLINITKEATCIYLYMNIGHFMFLIIQDVSRQAWHI